MLFNTINSVLNVPQSTCTDISSDTCDKFLNVFVDKIYAIRASVSLPFHDPSFAVTCPAAYCQFSPVSLTLLRDTISRMEFTAYPSDCAPPKIFKDIFYATLFKDIFYRTLYSKYH